MENRFIPNEVLDYCENHSSALPLVTRLIYNDYKHVQNSHMMIGKTFANIVFLLVLLHKPKTVLEIGTFYGYTTSLLLSGYNKATTVYSIEEDKATYDIAKENLNCFINQGHLILINDEGMSFLSKCDQIFDMIFIDARKECYFNRINYIHNRLSVGGILVIDNTLAGLNVFNPLKAWHEQTVYFNETILNDDRFFKIQLPIRDGIAVCVKVK